MNNYEQLEDKAQYLSESLQAEISRLAMEFDKTIRATGQKYGLNLLTEVTVGIDYSNLGE